MHLSIKISVKRNTKLIKNNIFPFRNRGIHHLTRKKKSTAQLPMGKIVTLLNLGKLSMGVCIYLKQIAREGF